MTHKNSDMTLYDSIFSQLGMLSYVPASDMRTLATHLTYHVSSMLNGLCNNIKIMLMEIDHRNKYKIKMIVTEDDYDIKIAKLSLEEYGFYNNLIIRLQERKN